MPRPARLAPWAAALAACLVAVAARAGDAAMDIEERVEHGYAFNDGVKIHYAALGEGPVVLFIHGFPDFWYSWRHQMEAISETRRCVAVDQRGYNLSDRPEGVDNYDMSILVADIEAVLKSVGAEKATIVGHDWGGMVAWSFAMTRPHLTEKLVILNLPHPNGLARELANNPDQQKNSAYARNFQQPDAASKLNAAMLAFWVKDPEARKKYVEAFKRSDFEAMLNYYKKNYPREPYPETPPPMPKVTMPVLMFHGLDDPALLPGALNDTWKWLEKDLTLVTIPGSGHFVQQDAAETVTKTMKWWIENR